MKHWEKKLYAAADELLHDRHEPDLKAILASATKVLPSSIGGEAILTVGRAMEFASQNAAMVVNVSPFSCMPGTITTAVFRQLSVDLKMPIVNLFYDGTGGQNRRLEVYLRTALNANADTGGYAGPAIRGAAPEGTLILPIGGISAGESVAPSGS
jgi:predicted nucleotide-binding protein (sugar kinase/HSP70/actin superfamily)